MVSLVLNSYSNKTTYWIRVSGVTAIG